MDANEQTLPSDAIHASRRGVLKGIAAGAVGAGAIPGLTAVGARAAEATPAPPAGFVAIAPVSPDYFIPGRFAGKVLLVTGAATGTAAQGITSPDYRMSIGAATAIRAAREGARVACVDVKRDGLADTLDRIARAGGTAVAIEADVTSSDDADRMVAETLSAFGKIDLALNAAGVLDGTDPAVPVDYDADRALLPAPIHEATDAYWERVMAVNATGVFKSLRAELRQLLRQGTGGAIVNIGSIAGLTGLNGNPAYSASKHAVTGITRNAALDYARYGIRVNSVNMAQTDTPMVFRANAFVKWARANRPGGGEILKQMSVLQLVNPAHPGATPWEQAAPILFLLSPDASDLTGGIYATEGGWTAY